MRSTFLGLVGFSLLGALPALAMQLQVTRPQLCGISSAVVLAETTSSEVRWSTQAGGGIETVVWASVERTLHGDAPGTVQLMMPGGTIGDIGMGQSDTPELDIDRRYLLFVQQSGTDWKVIGGDQGAILLEGGVAGVPGQGEATDLAVASVSACVAP